MPSIAESFENILDFIRLHFVQVMIYQVLFFTFYLIVSVIFGGLFFAFFTGEHISFGSLGNIMIIGVILFTMIALVQFGGYPILVKQAIQNEKIKVSTVIGETFRNFHRIIATALITGFITFLPLIIITLLSIFYVFNVIPYFLSPENIVVGRHLPPTEHIVFLSIGFIVSGIITLYLLARSWLSIPILMVEESGILDSLNRSWLMSSRRAMRMIFAIIVFGLIVCLLIWLLSLIPFVGFLVSYLFLGPLIGAYPSVYYYVLREELAKKPCI
ncbi:MAG: hypothetical protein QMD36_06380 [Candidatus Aenigmarchaeota archaeon]|nr:hypothetical protein [Candidatus Aenigmarchaeota archaeon]